ncbi:MAG: hypothetical protein RKL32_07795, partial [Gammaproteobacteria bacterium]
MDSMMAPGTCLLLLSLKGTRAGHLSEALPERASHDRVRDAAFGTHGASAVDKPAAGPHGVSR